MSFGKPALSVGGAYLGFFCFAGHPRNALLRVASDPSHQMVRLPRKTWFRFRSWFHLQPRKMIPAGSKKELDHPPYHINFTHPSFIHLATGNPVIFGQHLWSQATPTRCFACPSGDGSSFIEVSLRPGPPHFFAGRPVGLASVFLIRPLLVVSESTGERGQKKSYVTTHLPRNRGVEQRYAR